jgi:hypothetical protein
MHTGNAMSTRLSLLLIALMALPLLVGHGVSAQDATPADGSGATSDQFVDMSAFCEGIGTPTSGPSATASADLGLVPISGGKSVLLGAWDMPAGSSLILNGEASLLTVDEGLVMVVSCGGSLQYATEPAPTPEEVILTELPEGMGLAVDSSFADGIYLFYAGHPGTVAIVAQGETDSSVQLEVVGSEETDVVCSATECWDWTDVPPSPVPTAAAGLATPAAGPPRTFICGWFRC